MPLSFCWNIGCLLRPIFRVLESHILKIMTHFKHLKNTCFDSLSTAAQRIVWLEELRANTDYTHNQVIRPLWRHSLLLQKIYWPPPFNQEASIMRGSSDHRFYRHVKRHVGLRPELKESPDHNQPIREWIITSRAVPNLCLFRRSQKKHWGKEINGHKRGCQKGPTVVVPINKSM